MNHLKFAFWLLLFTVLELSQSLAQNSAPCNESFLKIIGAPDKSEAAYGVYDSKDGNLYLTATTGDYDSITFMKMDLHGNIFWSKSRNYYFNVSNPGEKPSDLIVDNQGRIVCIGTVGDDRRGIMFKYDPIAQTQTWSNFLILSTRGHGLVQDTIDGNYTIYARNREQYSTTWPATHASIIKIDKNSGAFVLMPIGSGIRYQSDSTFSDHIRSMVLHAGEYYGCGALPVENTNNTRMRPVVFKMNLDYEVAWTWMGTIGVDSLQHIYSEDIFIDSDQIIAVHTGDDGSATTNRSYVFLQKLSLDGQSIWLKKYDLGNDFPDALAKEVISVPDGFMIYGHRRGGSGLFFIKTDKSGNVLWARKLDTGASFLDDNGLAQSQIIWMQDGVYFAGMHQNVSGKTDLMYGKICNNGELGIDCPFLSDLQVSQTSLDEPAPLQASMLKQKGHQSTSTFAFQPWIPTPDKLQTTLCFKYTPPCDTIRKFETVQFCPGDTVWIASNAYITPGLVVDTIQGAAGCDTIISYKLLFYEPEAGALSISCPNNISVITGPGQAPVPIQYPLPTALSDCSCPGITINLDSGLSSGGLFPNGVTQVCYSAADPCGNTASCCFSVQVREEQACDIKIAGCVKYELLNITSDPDQNLTIKIRVTNNCSNPLDYTAIQLPAGVVAEAPLNNSIFLTENGHEYQVRNPNFSPVYSIRFKTNEPPGISGGQSDVFTYTLPGQSGKPNYVYVVSKLEPQSYYETHLNTFNCPVLPGNKQAIDRWVTVQHQQSLRIIPNPSGGRIQVDLGAMEGGQSLKLYNNQGKLVWETEVIAGSIATFELPEILVNGLYLITVGTESTRLMLQR